METTLNPAGETENNRLKHAVDQGLVKCSHSKLPRRAPAPIIPRADASGKPFPTTTELILEERDIHSSLMNLSV